VNFDFLYELYEWERFGEVFMTILTDIGWDLLLNVDRGKNTGSCEPISRHVIFRFAADHVHQCMVLQFAYASSLGCFQGAFSARSRKRSGGGALVSQNQGERKIEISTAMC
jgi:hypothetical protein